MISIHRVRIKKEFEMIKIKENIDEKLEVGHEQNYSGALTIW